MVDPNFSWIYLIIFLAIPLARIIPRFIARRKIQNKPTQQREFESRFEEHRKSQMETKPKMKEETLSKDRIVLRELNRGVKTFESIQKNTRIDIKELDSILADLERDGLLKVVQKQGLFGPKIELYPTDKGFREFYS